jgi:YbbR domain-containing protein
MKGTLLENYRVKLVVIALATLFWFAVVTENDYEYDIDVPVVLVNTPEGKIPVNDPPATARVRFEGKGRALLALLFSRDARVVLDLDNIRHSHTFNLRPQMVHRPRGGAALTPLQILAPDTVRVQLTNRLEKTIPVIAAVNITTVPGYTVVQPWRLDPDSVKISGPKETVRNIDSVLTVHKEFTSAQQRFSQRLRLQPFPESMRIRLAVDEIDFFADVQKLIEVTLQEIPVQVQNVPARLKVTPVPSTLSLTVEGGEQLLLNLKREDIKAYIDFARIRGSETEGHPAYIRTPDGVRYRDVKPAFFKLIMEVQNHAPARH